MLALPGWVLWAQQEARDAESPDLPSAAHLPPTTLQMSPQAEAPVLSPHSLPTRPVSSPKTSSHPPLADKASPHEPPGALPQVESNGAGI